MPCVQIDVRTQYTREQEISLMEAVHSALIESFKIPAHDKDVRLVVHQPNHFACPPTCTKPELYTLVCIDAFSGRSLDAKRNLYQSIVIKLEQLGIPKDHVKIILRESPKENWGVRGGQAACDIELGFKVEV